MTQKPEVVTTLGVRDCHFAHVHHAIQPSLAIGGQENPLADEEELTVEVWGLLQSEEEGGPLPLPTFPVMINPWPARFSLTQVSSTH